jgi:flagellum-specific peptidoglycan hydrolase FlgJ
MTAAYKRQGLNDNAIKNLIAKNALESAWGKSAQGDYNFGNITAGKSWKGRIVEGGDKNAAGKAIT